MIYYERKLILNIVSPSILPLGIVQITPFIKLPLGLRVKPFIKHMWTDDGTLRVINKR